jgi:hypothetical protein
LPHVAGYEKKPPTKCQITDGIVLLAFQPHARFRYHSGVGTETAKTAIASEAAISPRLEKAIFELRELHDVLLDGEGLDVRILADFRDALNRVRNTAWSAQQYMSSKATNDSTDIISMLAGERLRATYQLCQSVKADLQSEDIKFQTGQLMELHAASKALTEALAEVLGKLK